MFIVVRLYSRVEVPVLKRYEYNFGENRSYEHPQDTQNRGHRSRDRDLEAKYRQSLKENVFLQRREFI